MILLPPCKNMQQHVHKDFFTDRRERQKISFHQCDYQSLAVVMIHFCFVVHPEERHIECVHFKLSSTRNLLIFAIVGELSFLGSGLLHWPELSTFWKLLVCYQNREGRKHCNHLTSGLLIWKCTLKVTSFLYAYSKVFLSPCIFPQC